MKQLIDKSDLIAEIKSIKECKKSDWHFDEFDEGYKSALEDILSFLGTLEMKEVDLDNCIQLTWEDIRELYIIFAEVDVEIELCKTTNIRAETIGYYQEVLKRFKAYKREGTNI